MIRPSTLRSSLLLSATSALLVSQLATVACGAPTAGGNEDGTLQGGGSTTGSGTGNGAGSTSGTTGGISITDGTGSTSAEMTNEETCVTLPDGTEECYCLRVAVLGTADSAANNANASAFRDWLNTKSNAAVTILDPKDPVDPQPKPTLTAEFLASYDVIILQLQGDSKDGPFWTYSADEIAALKTWVEAGGGIISLTGYNGMKANEETAASNQLLSAIAGMSYGTQDIVTGTTPLAYCWGGSEVVSDWVSTSPVAYELEQVGAYHGYPVTGGDPVARDDVGNVVGATAQVGEGFVFAWTDEWVLFTNQWYAEDPDAQEYTDKHNPCFDKRPEQVFQLPQFWYNALNYAGGNRVCLTIDEPTTVVK